MICIVGFVYNPVRETETDDRRNTIFLMGGGGEAFSFLFWVVVVVVSFLMYISKEAFIFEILHEQNTCSSNSHYYQGH